jgi:hypothetical protein
LKIKLKKFAISRFKDSVPTAFWYSSAPKMGIKKAIRSTWMALVKE